MTLEDAFRETRALEVDLFQFCDFAPLLELSPSELTAASTVARDLGLTVELGTKGIAPDHLARFLELADTFDARLVRSMVSAPDSRPSLDEAAVWLRAAMPAYERAGVTLALETYEQVSSADLVALVESVDSPNLGICLDPANTVAALENPLAVIDRCAALTRNVHVKDFRFSRRDGWVGFTLEGTGFGTGLLDYGYLSSTVDPDARGINQIVEHWLPWQGDFDETARLEAEWTALTLEGLRAVAGTAVGPRHD